MSDQVFWGDLHAHCNVSYGRGTLERAFAAAREHLDFATVTGHATWHDMPRDRERYSEIVDYHTEGFARLRRNWDALEAATAAHHEDERFVTFLSYEWHSTRWGDRNVVYPGARGPIVDAEDPAALAAAVTGYDALAIPHHPGYGGGGRGLDWSGFDAERSPVVEMFSSHGSSEHDQGPRPIYHTMGPRVRTGTISHGLSLGHRFGLIGGSDHHGGYPGHYGAGRTAVLAPDLTRDAIWQALKERRCYAATGDKILVDFRIDDAPMGSVLRGPGTRRVQVDLRASDAIDHVDVIKNERYLARRFGPDAPAALQATRAMKVRLEWGWGEKGVPVAWNGRVHLSDGVIHSVERCFRGEEVLDPRDERSGAPEDELLHGVTEEGERTVSWFSRTFGNPHPSVPSTSGLVLELTAPADAILRIDVGDRIMELPLYEAYAGAHRWLMRGWLSEAFLVHRPVPEVQWTQSIRIDDEPQEDVDVYRVRVVQRNGQMAWSSPIWVER